MWSILEDKIIIANMCGGNNKDTSGSGIYSFC